MKYPLPAYIKLLCIANGNYLYRVIGDTFYGTHFYELANGESGYIDPDLWPDERELMVQFQEDYKKGYETA